VGVSPSRPESVETLNMKNGGQSQQKDGIPVEATNLSQRERELLPNPGWVAQDHADAIVAARRRRETPVPLERALKRYGRRRVTS
jgi:hypothetical protein